MRVKKEILGFFRERVRSVAPESRLFLFGSRNDDRQKGGDIDILILTAGRIAPGFLRKTRIAFSQIFGEQRVDLVNFSFDDNSPFKELAMLEGTEFS